MLILELFRLSPTPYVHACESPRAPWVVSAFVILTGILYGVLTALFQRQIGGEMSGFPVAEIPLPVLIVGNVGGGLLVTVVAHVGITIIAWLMAKAIGGPGLLIGIYRATAYLLPFLWLTVPYVAWTAAVGSVSGQATAPGLGLHAAALLGIALFLYGLFQIYLLTQGRGPQRAALGALLFALFTGSVLYITAA